MFPPELPEMCIKLCGYPVNVVLDPFAGSSTVAVAAKTLGKSFIMIEKNSEHISVSEQRIKSV
jgi:DNA modification methylase